MIKTVDLFAGGGGLSLGFQNAGFEIVAAFDSWDAAIKCYSVNFQHQIYSLDLSNVEEAVNIISEFSPSLIIGGPPCQDFSHAGKRSENKNASLTCAFAEIVTKLNVPWFVMENVDRVRNSNAYNKAKDIIKTAGYGITEVFLDACLCGVPQRRKRFFCIGSISLPDNFLNGSIDSLLSKQPMTVRQYLGDELDIDYYYRHPRNYSRRGVFSVDEPGPTVRGVNRPIPPGYKGHKADPAPVTEELRPLTTIERARLQTFPKTYKWIGSKTDLEQIIGNAVPVKQAELVARALLSIITEENTFRERCKSWKSSANSKSGCATMETCKTNL